MKLILTVIVGILVAALFSFRLKLCKKQRCLECHSRRCILVKRENKGETEIEIQKVKNIMTTATGQRGPVMPYSVSNRRYIVPGKRLFFDATYLCKSCGKEFVCPEVVDVEI